MVFFIGAGNGNRTRIKSLGSSHSTIELYPQILPQQATFTTDIYDNILTNSSAISNL